MGYIHKPIPRDIFLKMPAAIREKAIQQERQFLSDVHARQGSIAAAGDFILLMVLAAFAIAIAFFSN